MDSKIWLVFFCLVMAVGAACCLAEVRSFLGLVWAACIENARRRLKPKG